MSLARGRMRREECARLAPGHLILTMNVMPIAPKELLDLILGGLKMIQVPATPLLFMFAPMEMLEITIKTPI